ncbi:MAG: aminotransferase class I/II-fold pyridoxal phosphate-dependent enzyme [Peptoniphilaceae bacterium]|nr:aminotransferase class I/II-fold pyridoxal phosphate-dependent enzyme [Peptoniphilaceae bacterium]MDY6085829.1 aminotransferase class I/II-fold pyridoxal phosphate-dependent enzyme [Peptoniphilaceae bacterium]
MRFDTDYIEGCHPRILERLAETNFEQEPGYGRDAYCARAAECIRAALGRPAVAVHFVPGGTQANVTVISHALRPYEGVLSPTTGHINGHETGATEARGHKVLPLPSVEAKITAEQVAAYLSHYRAMPDPEHEIAPKMVYLSQPTEQGTLYSKAELSAFREICDRYGLYLFVDGARLGYALATDANDVSLSDLADLCDAFTIGGTKVGAMFGEAIVIENPEINRDFRYAIKQNEGMLAKGRYLGLQFEALFTDDLYFENGRHGIEMASYLRDALTAMGYPFLSQSPTNQIFPILPRHEVEALEQLHAFERWEDVDADLVAVRFVTSWATRKEDLDVLIADLKRIHG